MYQRVGKAAYKADLNTTIELLNAIGNPQKQFKAVHIAGTNGKGSVSHVMASILQEAGFKTGLYTSPHLKDFRERIRMGGMMIEEDNVVDFINKYKSVIDEIKPSFFEMTVAMAYDYFANQNVDYAVLETGMGGRLDSTNICYPVVTAITNIGFDHTAFLGDSLEKIAVEKAGIIKNNIPIIIGRRQNETKAVFAEKAISANAEITYADEIIDIKVLNTSDGFKQHIDVWMENKLIIERIENPLIGDYQKENIATAISIANKMKENGHSIDYEQIASGISNVIKNTHFMGRWQKLSDFPLSICDTGHNIDGLKFVVNQLKNQRYDKLHFVFGMVNDKDADNILMLLPKNATYYFCRPDIPRGMDASLLKEKAFKIGLNGNDYSSVMEAYNSAQNNASNNDLVFVGGSTFVVAEIV